MLKHQTLSLALLISASILVSACSKKADAPAPEDVSTPAPVAAVAQEAASSVAVEEDPVVVQKREAMEFVLMEDKIANDPKGQWAISAKASSTYATNPEDSTQGYHAFRATGAPDTQTYGDYATAWTSKAADKGLEWLELEYANAVNANEIKIRQNNEPGAIISVDLYDEAGSAHNIWKGPDATQYKSSTISWLTIPFDKTAYKTKRVKITLATNVVSSWNEIDAVQLIGE